MPPELVIRAAIQELTPAQLERTLRPNAPDISLGAFDGERLSGIAECSAGEFAVVVADAWQARGRKLPALHGIVRKGNRAMLRLGRSLGFRAVGDPDPELVQMKLELVPG